MLRTPKAALAFVERHGIVLERATGAVPSLVEAIAGGPVRGSWWSHPDAHRIFRLLGSVHDAPSVLRCRLVAGKVTYAHERVWPALVRLADEIGPRRLDRLAQEHTATGAHRTVTTRYPDWVPTAVAAAARKLGSDEARAVVAPFVP
jgi:hypothetical protein